VFNHGSGPVDVVALLAIRFLTEEIVIPAMAANPQLKTRRFPDRPALGLHNRTEEQYVRWHLLFFQQIEQGRQAFSHAEGGSS